MLFTNLTNYIGKEFNHSVTNYLPNIHQFVPNISKYIQKTCTSIYNFSESRLDQYYNTLSQQFIKLIMNIEGEHLKTYIPIYLFLSICIISMLYYRNCFINLSKSNYKLKDMYELKCTSFEQLENLSSQYIENSNHYHKKYLFVLSQLLEEMQSSKKIISLKDQEIKMLTENKNLLSIHNKALHTTNKMFREKYDKKVLSNMLNNICDNIPVSATTELCNSLKNFANYFEIELTIVQKTEQNIRKNPPRKCKPTVFNNENIDSDFEN